MIKVLQLNTSSVFGGGEAVMFNIIKGLEKNFQFLVATPSGSFLKKYEEMSVKTFIISQKNLLGIVLKLKKLIKKEKPKILHCHGTRSAFWARLAIIGLKEKPKLIYTLHGFHIIRKPFFIKWLLLQIEKILNYQTDILVCVSETDKNLVLKYKTISPQKIKVIKNGIDVEEFQVNQEKVRAIKEEFGLKNNFILSSIGRLHLQKDFSTILKALKLVISEIPNVRLLIIGDGPLRKSLEKETNQLGLNEYVKFLGWREDVPVLISLSDVVILSTRWEGLPLVPLEVGASRKPIIASDVDGVRETIINGKTGFLFQPGSVRDLADKILKLYQDKDLRKRMGEEGYSLVLKNFSKEIMIQNYRNLYKSLL